MVLVDNEDGEMERSNMVEVCEIPAGTKRSTLVMILESQRHTGITGVRVKTLAFSTEDHSHALVTLCSADGRLYVHIIVDA